MSAKLSRVELIHAIERIWNDESLSRDEQARLMNRIKATIDAPYQFIVGAIHFPDDEPTAIEVADRLLQLDGHSPDPVPESW